MARNALLTLALLGTLGVAGVADADAQVTDTIARITRAADNRELPELRRDLEFDLHASTTAAITAAHTEPDWTRERWPEHRRLHEHGYRILTSPQRPDAARNGDRAGIAATAPGGSATARPRDLLHRWGRRPPPQSHTEQDVRPRDPRARRAVVATSGRGAAAASAE